MFLIFIFCLSEELKWQAKSTFWSYIPAVEMLMSVIFCQKTRQTLEYTIKLLDRWQTEIESHGKWHAGFRNGLFNVCIYVYMEYTYITLKTAQVTVG